VGDVRDDVIGDDGAPVAATSVVTAVAEVRVGREIVPEGGPARERERCADEVLDAVPVERGVAAGEEEGVGGVGVAEGRGEGAHRAEDDTPTARRARGGCEEQRYGARAGRSPRR